MDASTYYFKKNLITGAVLLFFMIVLMLLGSQLGYYQNGVQAYLSGIKDMQSAGTVDIQVAKNILVNLLVFIPVLIMVLGGVYNPQLGKNPLFRLLLLPPIVIYGISAFLDWKNATPFNEKFGDMYQALDHIIYIPFILCFVLVVAYMIAIICAPSSMPAKVIGSIAMVISICFYVIFGIYVIYLQAMSALDGSFGFNHFVLYLICFGLDVTCFFLMLSLLMSFCAMGREELLWEKDVIRRRRIDERRRQERETQRYYEEEPYEEIYEEYETDEDEGDFGTYMTDEDDEPVAEPENPEDMVRNMPESRDAVQGAEKSSGQVAVRASDVAPKRAPDPALQRAGKPVPGSTPKRRDPEPVPERRAPAKKEPPVTRTPRASK